MPVDATIINPMLDPFRNMLKEVIEKGLSGEDYDKMKAALDRMEELGQIHSDIMTYNGALMQENLFSKFSDHYGRLLANNTKQESEEKGYDDSTLLKQSLKSLKNAVSEIKRNYQTTINESKKYKNPKNKKLDQSVETAILNDPTIIIKEIEDLIKLGEQEGMTLPNFLRLQIEKGLDKAMEGNIVVKKGLQFTLDATIASASNPYAIKVDEEKLEAFNFLAQKNKFNIPNQKEVSYLHKNIDYKYRHQIAEWNEIKYRWSQLLTDLSFWSMSYTKIAPYIEPWCLSDNPVEATIKTQKTIPGIFQEKLNLLKKYFNLSFLDTFKHPTFIWNVENYHIGESQEFTTFLIEKVFPYCKPFNDIPQEVIDERLAMRENDKTDSPDGYKSIEKFKKNYDDYFGEGRFEDKFGKIEKKKTNAKPWDLSTFKYQ
jgi:hypothetical protein